MTTPRLNADTFNKIRFRINSALLNKPDNRVLLDAARLCLEIEGCWNELSMLIPLARWCQVAKNRPGDDVVARIGILLTQIEMHERRHGEITLPENRLIASPKVELVDSKGDAAPTTEKEVKNGARKAKRRV